MKTLLLLLAFLICLPSPSVLACACTEVVGGSGAVSSDLSVQEDKGSLELVQTDVSIPGVIPITLTRTYKSDSTLFGIFGPGWMVDFVSFVKDTFGDITIHFNGNIETFSMVAVNGYVNKKKTMRLTYTAANEITVVERSTGAQWVFNTDDNTLKKYTDRNGNTTWYYWKVVEITTGIADTTAPIKQNVFCPVNIVFPDGRMQTFLYDGGGKEQYLCRKVFNPDGTTVSYSYTNGLLTGVGMGSGQMLHYAYHKQTNPENTLGWLTKITYTNATEIGIEYNGQFDTSSPLRVTGVSGPLGFNHTYGYTTGDSGGAFTTVRTDSLGHATTFRYANNKQNELVKDALGHTTETLSNEQFQPTSVTNPRGKVTQYTYDTANTDEVAKRNLLSKTNPLGKTWNYTWNESYDKTKTVDPLGHETNYTYDTHHNLLSVRNALNQTVLTNGYTARGQLASVIDGANNKTGYEYDLYGNLTEVIDAEGTAWWKTYDNSGNLLTAKDPLGNTSTLEYNGLNKVTKATDALGKVTNFTYDEMANLTSVTDANNNVTSYGWDQFQRKTSITDALNNTTTFAYDAETNMTTLTDALGHALSYTYDGVNNKKTFKFPDNRQEVYSYDANDNLTNVTDCAGQQISYAYDDADRLTTKTYGDGTVFTNTYDDANRLTGVTRVKNGVTESSASYTLNAADQVTSMTANGKTIGYSYTANQLVKQVTYPSGAVANYAYDRRNAISTIKDAGLNKIAEYTKDDAGRVTKQKLGNGLETVYTYDANNRPTQIVLRQASNPSNVVQSFAYGYDNVGNRVWVQYKDGTGDVYKYDATYQLIGVKYGVSNPQAGYDAATNAVRTVAYVYDAVGNRTSVTDNGNSSTYTVNNLNQYTAVSGTNYTYSNRGDLTSDGTWTYSYDYEGHLVSAAKPGTTVGYKYDTQGRRIEKDINGAPAVKYVYDGNNLIEERDGTGNTVTAAYFYGGGIDHPVGVIKGGNAYYFQQDALGNVTSLTDSSGSLVEQYSYDVYGKPTIKDGNGNAKVAAMTPFLFTGREYDSETGLYHYRARAYSPELGRFTSRDPIGRIGGVNFYQYCANNAPNLSDPLGLDWRTRMVATTATVGGFAGAIVGGITGGGGGAIIGLPLGPTAIGTGAAGASVGAAEGGAIGAAAGAAVGTGVVALASIINNWRDWLNEDSQDSCPKTQKPPQGDNVAKNKQFSDALKELGIKENSSEARALHEAITGKGLSGFREIVEFARANKFGI